VRGWFETKKNSGRGVRGWFETKKNSAWGQI